MLKTDMSAIVPTYSVLVIAITLQNAQCGLLAKLMK
jgi:hypothetical protein